MDLFSFLKSRLPIVDVIGGYVQLRPSGHYLKSSCPFHRETDASFTVSPDKQIFYCFGCHATGDVIAFMAKIENVSQMEAAKLLVERHNIVLPTNLENSSKLTKVDHDQRDLFTKTCKAVAEWTHAYLLKTPSALEYVKMRGVSDAAIKLFGIGLMPSGVAALNAMIKELAAHGVMLKNLLEAGVIAEAKAYVYSPFEERIIFPIKDSFGRHCGFGGRIFRPNDQRSKYYNSKESEYFLKGTLLFGYDQAKKNMQESATAFLVEGYMDCVAMVQHGYGNTVATLGTACTIEHLKLLGRSIERLYVLYDGDAAGQQAILRIAELCFETTIDLYVIVLPAKEDPASYLQKNTTLNDLVSQAQSIFTYYLTAVGAHFSSKSMAKKIQAAEKMLELISKIQSTLKQDLLLQQAAKVMDLPLPTLKQALAEHTMKQLKKAHFAAEHGPAAQTITPATVTDVIELEEKIVYALLEGNGQGGSVEFEKDLLPYFSPELAVIAESLVRCGQEHASDHFSTVCSKQLPDEAQKRIARISIVYNKIVSVVMLDQLTELFLKHHWKIIVKDMKEKMADASQQHDAVRLQELFSNFSRLKQRFVEKRLI